MVLVVLVGLWWWCRFGVGCDCGIVVVLMVMAAVRVVVVISSDLFNCMFCGSICSFGSRSGVSSSCGGSSLAHQFNHY